MGFPILVKSVQHWFKREYPNFPLDCVAFLCNTEDYNMLNPYDARLIVRYAPADYLFEVFGFHAYGSDQLLVDAPPMPTFPEQVFNFTPTMDEIKAYVHAIYPDSNPVIDLLILSVGCYDWHHVDFIPLACLQYIGMPLPQECAEPPTLEDYQTAFALGIVQKPQTWYNVDLSQVPNDLARHLSLYRGGKVHLPDVLVWRVVVKTFDNVQGQLEFVKYICDSRTQKKRRRLKHVQVINSREQVEARMPPCIEKIVGQQKHFPYDQERQQLVRTWAKAGVELKLVGDILDELNAKYPHADRPVTTQRRWDYVSHYKRGYAPPSCEKMACPLAPGQPIDVKKSECFKLFMDRFPDKTPHARSFYGPIKWYEW
jgi:hypothetical protein